MKFENTQVFNLEGALRGMRNPLNSWNKSDSKFGLTLGYPALENWHKMYEDAFGEEPEDYLDYMHNNVFVHTDDKSRISEYALVGPKDLDLAQRLCGAGPEHRKFLRQIFVSVDITAPIYWWKEADTYKIGTTANSTSTMHKLATTPITLDCIETGDFVSDLDVFENDSGSHDEFAETIIEICESLRKRYLETNDKRYWKELIRWLPCGWLQTRTWTANYEVIRAMYHQRKNHKLTEWSEAFCSWAESLPYAKELILT